METHGLENGSSLFETGLVVKKLGKGFSNYVGWFRVAKGRFDPDVEA